MEISSDNHIEAICTVTELAKKLSLSRARFYQLVNMDIFPMPVYCIRTKRPFYPLGLQQQCMEIRKTGIGHNGQPIIFYRVRKGKPAKSQNPSNVVYEQLVDTLRQLGMKITISEVKNAINTLYPRGTAGDDDGTIIRDLFRHFSHGM